MPCPASQLDGFLTPSVIPKDDTVATITSLTQRRTQETSPQVIPSPLEQRGIHQLGSKVLPEINHMGMIIFYLHIPKTGGELNHEFSVRSPDQNLTLTVCLF